jgi:uncharacterized membrane protein
VREDRWWKPQAKDLKTSGFAGWRADNLSWPPDGVIAAGGPRQLSEESLRRHSDYSERYPERRNPVNAIVVASAMAAALVFAGCAGSTKQTAQAQAQPQMAQGEKCFGVAKAGMNDCKAGSHSCKGMSTVDADPESFMLLPAGTCDKLVGGKAT